MLDHVTVTRYVTPLREGGSLPAIVEADSLGPDAPGGSGPGSKAIRPAPHRGRDARRGLAQSRRETAAVSKDRDDLIDQRDTARAYTASTLGDGTPRGGGQPSPRGRLHLFGHRSASPPAAGAPDGPALADDSAGGSQP